MGVKRAYLSLQTKITILVCGVVVLSLLVVDMLVTSQIQSSVENNVAHNATDIARIVARSPMIIEGLEGSRDEQQIQNFTEEIRHATNVEFIVVMDWEGYQEVASWNLIESDSISLAVMKTMLCSSGGNILQWQPGRWEFLCGFSLLCLDRKAVR